MRTHITVSLVLATCLILVSGCGKPQGSAPDARLTAEVQRLGLPEVLARARQEATAQPTAESFDYLARALALSKQPKPARTAIEKAVSLDPNYEPSATVLAQALMQEGKDEAASQMMRGLLQKKPDASLASEVLCRVLLKQRKPSEAVTAADEALKHDARSGKLLWARADAKAALKQFDEAEKDYRRAMKLEPKNVPVRMGYVQSLMRAGKQEEGTKFAEETVSMAPNSADVRFMAASALHQAGKLDEALKEYKEALIINPAMIPAANNLALLLADRQQDCTTAVAWARKASVMAPRSVAVADTLGWALARDGQYSDAANVLRSVNKAWTNNPTVWYHLGWTLAKSGNKGEGVSLLQRAADSGGEVAAEALKALQEVR
ncbi:MAG: tetratricopeptide repeat protein [Bacteroidota bacterium]